MKNSIEKYRKQMGWTQEEFAEKIFSTKSTISRWEKGVSEPDFQTLKLMSKLFNVTIDELLSAPGDNTEVKVKKTKGNKKPLISTLGFYSGFENRTTDKRITKGRIILWVLTVLFTVLEVFVVIYTTKPFRGELPKNINLYFVAWFVGTPLGIVSLVLIITSIVRGIWEKSKSIPNANVDISKKQILIHNDKDGSKKYPFSSILSIGKTHHINSSNNKGKVFRNLDSDENITELKWVIEILFEDNSKIKVGLESQDQQDLLKTLKGI